MRWITSPHSLPVWLTICRSMDWDGSCGWRTPWAIHYACSHLQLCLSKMKTGWIWWCRFGPYTCVTQIKVWASIVNGGRCSCILNIVVANVAVYSVSGPHTWQGGSVLDYTIWSDKYTLLKMMLPTWNLGNLIVKSGEHMAECLHIYAHQNNISH